MDWSTSLDGHRALRPARAATTGRTSALLHPRNGPAACLAPLILGVLLLGGAPSPAQETDLDARLTRALALLVKSAEPAAEKKQ